MTPRHSTTSPQAATSAGPSPAARIAVGLFVASVGYWAYRYFVVFGRAPDQAGPTWPALGWNVALFAAFASHHSLLARSAIKAVVERRWPGGERSIYIGTASVLLIVVCAGWQPLAGSPWHLSGAAAAAADAVRIVAFAWIVVALRALDLKQFLGLCPTNPPIPKDSPFSTTGPYGVVRHPIYAGWLVVVGALPVITSTQLAFAACGAAYIVIGLELEEWTLRTGPHGTAYQDYARKVPAKLVPFVY